MVIENISNCDLFTNENLVKSAIKRDYNNAKMLGKSKP
jgi:hypothetical protein